MSKKTLKSKRRPTRKRLPKRLASLKKKVEQGPLKGQKIVVAPQGEVKMSDVLIEFIEPI